MSYRIDQDNAQAKKANVGTVNEGGLSMARRHIPYFRVNSCTILQRIWMRIEDSVTFAVSSACACVEKTQLLRLFSDIPQRMPSEDTANQLNLFD